MSTSIEPRGEVYAQVVRSSPAAGGFGMYTTFLLAVSAARESINITNPYFVLDRVMQQALIAAARRGVRVQVLVPGAIDHNIVRQASRRQFGDMLRAGIQIHEYTAALLHSKTMVIDGRWATIGTTNFDDRSFLFNDESNVSFVDPALVKEMDRTFRDDLEKCRRVSYAKWRKRGLTARAGEFVASFLKDKV